MVSPRVCPTCGETIHPTAGECLYCAGLAELPAAPAAAPADPNHAFGLLLFEAEECLHRGQADKAAVLASRAVRARPANLTARALYERARRELLQGRRREKLEARVQEAEGLLQRGELDAANRIVTSALKLVPDHPVALALFGQIKQRRQAVGTAEAEAERELERFSRLQAQQALGAARAALAAGWERRALGALRRGLRMVPDDRDLLDLLRQVQSAGEALDRETAQRRAVHPQIRAGLDLLAQGDLDGSLRVLRAVLKEDPKNTRAQSAVQDVRRAWLARPAPTAAVPASAAPVPAPPAPAPVRPAAATPRAAPSTAPRPSPSAPRTTDGRPTPLPPRRPTGTGPRSVYHSGPRTIPGEILLPRTRRRATPVGLIVAGAAIVFAGIAGLFLLQGGPSPAPRDVVASAPPPTAAPVATTPAAATEGPLANADPVLRRVIVDTLAEYTAALESQDAQRLALARPDLAPADRARILSRFTGALNAGVDLRVLDVVVGSTEAVVPILRTDVIVGGRGGENAPEEETLRFERRPEGWVLSVRRR